LLYKEKPGIIYSASLHAILLSQVCSLILQIPHIASVRNNPIREYKSFFVRFSFTLLMFLQNGIVFISQRALDEYFDTIYGKLLKRKRVFVLHNPIVMPESIDDSNLFKKFAEIKQKISNFLNGDHINKLDGPILKFVMVSRLVDGKGIMEVLEQISLPFKNKGLHLSIYGAGPLESQIRDYINSVFLSKNVVLEGFCANLNKIFSNSDIIIFPSRSEGFGRSPFEAMFRGNLVLCNQSVSIINEFLEEPMVWNDYSEPLDLIKCIENFASIDPQVCVDEVKEISRILNPITHALEFEKITTAFMQG
jgi:hypothetical protein